MQGYQYQSDFARKYFNAGRVEGRVEGREHGLRDAVLTLARSRLVTVTPDDESALEALHDEHDLIELIAALGTAETTSQARATLDRIVRKLP